MSAYREAEGVPPDPDADEVDALEQKLVEQSRANNVLSKLLLLVVIVSVLSVAWREVVFVFLFVVTPFLAPF